jgi:hypothetical protein
LVFNNSSASLNKSPSKIYFRYNGNWREAGGTKPVADADIVAAGSGVIVRKYPASGAVTAFWSNNPTY